MSRDIQDAIKVFGVATVGTFNAITEGEIQQLEGTLVAEQLALAAENLGWQDSLDALTGELIQNLIATREEIELRLSEHQNAQEAADEAQRDVDQVALVTLKNTLWKEMSWLVRQSHSGFAYGQGGHKHGTSAGPIYGFVATSHYAQVAGSGEEDHGHEEGYDGHHDTQNVNIQYAPDAAHPKPLPAVDDGYDPYGYGDYGFGYGGAQVQYKAIQEKLAAMVQAQAEIVQKNEDRIAASRAALDQVQEETWAEWTAAQDAKWATMTETIAALNAAKAAAIEARTATFEQALADARGAIAAAQAAKSEALDHQEEELRWSITSIYNYDVQHALNEALTAAATAQEAACVDRNAALEIKLQQIEAAWATTVEAECATYEANTAEESTRCEAVKYEQSDLLTSSKHAQQVRFAAWAQGEREALAAFVAECDEAWQWILESYCLRHGTEGDVTSAGYGCSYGQGSGFGNGGFRKGIAVEEHDAILSYGQDLDIKHVQDTAGLVQHAVDFTMEGVAGEAAAQQEAVNEMQVLIDGAVAEARQLLADSLTQRLEESVASLDGTLETLTQALTDRQATALALLDADRLTYQQAVADLREKLLWDIKEIVWRLGYSQGYAYGAHDGHDLELQAQIAQKKDEFEQQVIATLQMMQNRVLAERQAGEEAAAEAQAELDGEFARLTQEMEEALAAAQASFELTLSGGKDAMAGETARATNALNAFIAERLAAWQEKYTYEEINAKWQEDSYYRYNLLRLLAAKQEAIEEAVAQAKADFAAAMAAERAESTAFRKEQRDAFADLISTTRQALADAIDADDAVLAAAIEELAATLDAALADQQGQLEVNMEEARQEMKKRLQEIYNYNSYDWDASQQQDTPISPYSHEQHQAFVTKFAFFLKDLLHQYDAAVGNMQTATTAKAAGYTEESLDQAEDLKRLVQDRADAAHKRVGRLAKDLLSAYAETQDAELALLRDARAAAESAAYSAGEGFKKDIIYSMHVLRYAGGEDKGGIGFGHFASSYHGKGNALTGIDELDLYRLPTDFGYAQIAAQAEEPTPSYGLQGPAEEGHAGADLVQMLVDAKQGFDDMIVACREDFADLVATEKLESANRRAQVNADVAEAADAALAALATAGAEAEADLIAADAERQAAMLAYTDNILYNFNESVVGQMVKFQGWFGEKLAEVARLYDSTYKEHLQNELETKLAAALESLQRRMDAATAVMDAANLALTDSVQAHQADLWGFHDEQTFQLETFVTDTKANTAAAATATNDAFCHAALVEDEIKNASADQLVRDWAFWLKYVYGYQAYDDDQYEGYDDTADYGDGYAAKGFHDELAEPGTDRDHFAGSLPTPPGYQQHGGFGYGGGHGRDYLGAEDGLGLAHASAGLGIQGPSAEYFPSQGGFLDAFRAKAEKEAKETEEKKEETTGATASSGFSAYGFDLSNFGVQSVSSSPGGSGSGSHLLPSSADATSFINGMLALYSYSSQQYSGLVY